MKHVSYLINACRTICALIPYALIYVLFTKSSCESRQAIACVLRTVTASQACGTVHTWVGRVALRGFDHLTGSPYEPWSTDAPERILFIQAGCSILAGLLHALINISLREDAKDHGSDERHDNHTQETTT